MVQQKDIYKLIADSKNFGEVLKVLQRERKKMYFFEVSTKDFHAHAESCNLKEHNKFVPFNWEMMLVYGSKKQKNLFNRFRNFYIKFLLDSVGIDGRSPICSIRAEIVGTVAKSAESDVNVNIVDDEKRGCKQMVPNTIEKIALLHSKYFANTLDELFDINVYGTIFRYENYRNVFFGDAYAKLTDKVEWIKRQYGYSFLRIYAYAETIKISKKHIEFYETAKSIHDVLKPEFDIRKYIQCMKDYYTGLRNDVGLAHLSDLFSKSKCYERETYRSIGALLHIVMNSEEENETMQPVFFEHSIYDNFGFVLENLYEKSKCEKSMNKRIDKIAKYVYRMCDALLYMGVDKGGFVSKVKNISKRLNEQRRVLDTESKELSEIRDKFMKTVTKGHNNCRIAQCIYQNLVCLSRRIS